MLKRYFKSMRERYNLIKDNNRGFAFVFVVVGVMAVAVIGATVLSLATNYYLSVMSDQRSGESFNSAEGVLGEIRSGIEEIAGYSNEEAYLDVMENYGTSSYQSKMYAKYGAKYLSGIVNGLQQNALANKANVKGTVNWDGVEEASHLKWHTLSIDTVKKMTTRPESIKSVSLRYGFTNDKNKLSLTIKDLYIDYTDTLGYNSKIKTDIVIDVPDFNFEGNSTLEEMKNYISITDNIFDVYNDSAKSSGASGADVTGNIYSGGETGKNGESDNYGTGMKIGSGAKASLNSKMIISRGDMKLLTGADLQLKNHNGQQWVKNIVLGEYGSSASTEKTNLDVRGSSYVLDDLSVEVNNSIVNLAGKYYGYGYNANNIKTDPTTESDYSSAILVNGKNTYLTSKGLQKLILSGRTFVSKNDKEFKSMVSDIMMGESLAVKSNQIAYLLPDKFVSPVELPGSRKRGQHNPLLTDEIINEDTICLATGNEDINIDALKHDMAWKYLNQTKPLIANYSNTAGYVYLYYNFKSQVDANKYFKEYCETKDDETDEKNQTLLDDRAEAYISTTDPDGMKIDAALYLIAGNIIHNYYSSTGSKFQSANYFNSTTVTDEMLADGQVMMTKYLGKQLALVNSGFKGGYEYRYENMPSGDQSELVKDVIVDFSKAGSLAGSHYDIESDGTVYIADGDITTDSSIQKGILICDGDVTVNTNFTGLILASGKVTYEGNVKAVADPSLVGDLLQYIKDDPELYKIIRFFEKKDKNSNLVAECISYDNWNRNSD